MPLAFEVDDVATVDEPLRALYTKDEKSGKFRLGVEGLPVPEDTTGLKKKVDELLAEKKASDTAKKKAEEDARKAAEESARKTGDVAALENSWKEKFTARETELTGETKRLGSVVTEMKIDAVAESIANAIAVQGSANVLIPHIRNRLSLDWVDGKPVTRVLGLDGKPSALTLEELKAEFAANPAFKPVISATKASGGGAAGAGGGAAGKQTLKRADFEALPANDKAKFFKDGGTLSD